jgi:hypothetical protein
MLADDENFAGLARINRELIGKAEAVDSPQRVVLDMDSTECSKTRGTWNSGMSVTVAISFSTRSYSLSATSMTAATCRRRLRPWCITSTALRNRYAQIRLVLWRDLKGFISVSHAR